MNGIVNAVHPKKGVGANEKVSEKVSGADLKKEPRQSAPRPGAKFHRKFHPET